MFSIIKNIKPFTLSLLTNTFSFERSNFITLRYIKHHRKRTEYKKAEECTTFQFFALKDSRGKLPARKAIQK
jgi:hypothetical protein